MNSEFVSSDEHITLEDDDFDELLSDEEIENLGYSSLSVTDHSDFWSDFDQINPNDIPY